MPKLITTLCCVYNENQFLLGRIKKNGVTKDRFNAFGGKVEDGETIEQAALRELKEEAGIDAIDIAKRGVLNFIFDEVGNPFDGKPQIEMHIYSASNYAGTPTETDEMQPAWFDHGQIPYARMWPDDIYWLPLLLAGKNFAGTFWLKDPSAITNYKLTEIN